MGQSARLLGWPVLQSYGMTETASQVATEPLDHLDLDYSPDALELLPHWTAALSDDGMLKLSGDALATGYIIPHEDGWQWQLIGGELVTRDKVSLWQAEGRRWLTFVGREAQMLKILGELVHLGDLQARLMKLARQMIPGAVVALGAKPEERRGHELVLYFQLGTVAPEAVDMLLKAYHAEVRGFERITRIDAVPGPLFNEMGKVLAQH
jgi:O-succinylbenzoic acid--CoA ligase